MRTKLDIQTLQRAKGNAVAFYNAAEDKEFWQQVIDDCDEEIIEISKEKPLFSKPRIVAILIVALILIALSGCQFASGCGKAVQGLGGDIQWLADGYIEQSK